jgi:glucuronosyltransferase
LKKIGFGVNIPLLLMMQFPERVSRLCKLCYSDQAILELMNSGEHFDLLVVEAVLNECALPLVAHFKAPFIYMTSVIPSVWTFEALGNPMSFDHFPIIVYDYTDRMTLLERTVNTLTGIVAVAFRNWFMLPRVDQLARQMLNITDLPRAQDIEKNVTLLVTNAHFSINYNYPKTPSIVEAAAIHCVPAKPLPQVNLNSHQGYLKCKYTSR